ncbi:MAG: hypothetical protein J6A59_00955 [Lachnospiraceae bacterium]|nr:hypothetical protein [Lachnospiraceae bacterium]
MGLFLGSKLKRDTISAAIDTVVEEFTETLKPITIHVGTYHEQELFFKDNMTYDKKSLKYSACSLSYRFIFTKKEKDLLLSRLPYGSYENVEMESLSNGKAIQKILITRKKEYLKTLANGYYSNEYNRFYDNIDVEKWCNIIKNNIDNFYGKLEKLEVKKYNGVEVESENKMTRWIYVHDNSIDIRRHGYGVPNIEIIFKEEGYIPKISPKEQRALSLVIYFKTGIFADFDEGYDYDPYDGSRDGYYIRLICKPEYEHSYLEYKKW